MLHYSSSNYFQFSKHTKTDVLRTLNVNLFWKNTLNFVFGLNSDYFEN